MIEAAYNERGKNRFYRTECTVEAGILRQEEQQEKHDMPERI